MSKKREQKAKQVVGAPDIAHPRDQEAYEKQLTFIYAWFFEMLDRCEGDDEKAATEARAELQTLFLYTARQLMRLALKKKDSAAKKWAGLTLANIGVGVWKHDKKLCKTNEAYRCNKKKIGKLRTDVLFPKSPIGIVVQRELNKAERHRKQLLILKKTCGEGQKPQWLTIPGMPPRLLSHGSKGWKEAARSQNISEAYWPLVKLRDFSKKSEPKWWEFLWPLIREDIDIGKLDLHYKLARKRYPSDSEKTARDHLRLLARLRDKGIRF